MTKQNLPDKKDNKSYLQTNPEIEKLKAEKVLKKAKEQEAQIMSSGKRYVRIDRKTQVLR